MARAILTDISINVVNADMNEFSVYNIGGRSVVDNVSGLRRYTYQLTYTSIGDSLNMSDFPNEINTDNETQTNTTATQIPNENKQDKFHIEKTNVKKIEQKEIKKDTSKKFSVNPIRQLEISETEC